MLLELKIIASLAANILMLVILSAMSSRKQNESLKGTDIVYIENFTGTEVGMVGNVSDDAYFVEMLADNRESGNICLYPSIVSQKESKKTPRAGISYNITDKISPTDVMVMVPYKAGNPESLLLILNAWAKVFIDSGSFEAFTFDGKTRSDIDTMYQSNTPETPQISVVMPSGYRVRSVRWGGIENGITSSLTTKVRKHMRYVSNNLDDPQYVNKKWFFKADTDSYVVTDHLLRVLSQYDPNEPWYIGYQFEKSGYKYISGGGYLISRAAMEILGGQLNSPLNKRNYVKYYEDMMIGSEFEAAGVHPTNHMGFHWRRLFQREETWGVTGGLVLTHKVKDKPYMDDLVAWTKYLLFWDKQANKQLVI